MTVDHWQHKGWIIHVDTDGMFTTIDPTEPADPEENPEHQERWRRGGFASESLGAIKKRIDQATNRRKRQKAEAIELPIYTSKGHKGDITGLNIHTGKPLGIPEGDTTYADIYPYTDWVVATVAEINLLHLLISALSKKLETVKLKTRYKEDPHRYNAGDPEAPETYADWIVKLREDYTQKLLKAEGMAEEMTELNQKTAARRSTR